MHFSNVNSLNTSIRHYSEQMDQSVHFSRLMIRYSQLSVNRVCEDPSIDMNAVRMDIDGLLELNRNLKNSLMGSRVYFDVFDQTSRVHSLSGNDNRLYRLGEIFEQIVGRCILVKEKILKGCVTSTEFTLSNENYYFILMNGQNIILPALETVRKRMVDTALSIPLVYPWSVSLSIFVSALILSSSILLFWMIRAVMQLKIDLFSAFIKIPENRLKVYHGQTEYFVLLFLGMEDKHLDDIKNEVSSLRKLQDQSSHAGNMYGKKRKRLISRGVFQTKNILLLVSLQLAVFLYFSALVGVSLYESSQMGSITRFMDKEKLRALSYVSCLVGLYAQSVSPSLQVRTLSPLEYSSGQLTATYSIDSEIDSVDKDNTGIL